MKPCKSLLVFSLIILFFTAPKAFAIIGQLFSSDSNLSSSLINDILYDKSGMLWVATEDGLNRGDGSKFTIYKNNPNDPHSIANNFVQCVVQDVKGHVLVGTYAGIQLYDPLHDNFSELACFEDGKTPYHGTVQEFVPLKSGGYLAVGDDVNKVKVSSKGKVVVTPVKVPKEIVQPNNAIEDEEGNIWYACDLRGVFRVDKNNKVKRYFQNHDTKVEDFNIGPNKKLYVGTMAKGLFVYDKATDSFVHLLENTIGATYNVKHILNTKDGKMLLSTDGQGLDLYNPKTNMLEDITVPLFNDKKLKVHKTITDQYDNMWLALYQQGLFIIPKMSYGFQAMRQNTPPYANIIGSSCITSLLKDKTGKLWVGTDNDGLYELEPDLKSSRHHTANVPPIIMTLYEDSKSNLWIGTYSSGTGILNRNTGKFTPIELKSGNGMIGRNVYYFVETEDGTIWIATMGAGLFSYKNGVVNYDEKLNANLNQWITSIVYAKKTNFLYLGTYNGIYKIKLASKTVEQIYDKLIVNKLFGDTKHSELWAATNTGLTKICRDHSKNRTYTMEDGLPSNTLYSIESDGNALWISTSHGLSRFNRGKQTFSNFFVEDGLQSNEFYKNTSCVDSKGTIFFGGTNGLTYFSPENIGVSGSMITISLTDFYLKGKAVRGGTLSGGSPIIEVPISEAKEFNLSHDDNSFSIEFSTRQHINSSQLQFRYSFDDETWKLMPNKSSASLMHGGNMLNFTDVPSGSHTLRIKATCNGIESPELELTINIAWPWYASWWARLIYLLLFILVIYKIYEYTQKNAERKRQELFQKHEDEIKESKLRFFTNISHEIRTPLSLVMSPLEKLIANDSDSSRQRTYKTMYRNATRILKLVNELMDLRKIDNGHMHMKFSKIMLVDFIKDLYETFEQAAVEKEIIFKFNHDECNDLEVWVDPTNFDKIIVNILSNAFKFTPKGGHINIDVTKGKDTTVDGPLSDYVQISITDTGKGIPEEARAHIFDRFYQVDSRSVGGTGIGLHITYLLVKLHHGTIDLADNPLQQGTQFSVRIPLGSAHLTQEELSGNTDGENITPTNNKKSLINTINSHENTETAQTNKPKKNQLVYITEDDFEIKEYLTQSLGETYKIRCFQNGNETLAAMHQECPDLVITDVMMPEMDGYTLTKKIKTNINLNHVPVIILSAKNREEEQLEGLEQGADAYITKPFNIDILCRTVANLINLRKQLRNVYSGNQSREDSIDKINVVSNDEKLMEKIMQVVNKNLNNPDLTIEMLAKEVGISRVHLHRKLKELTNQSSSHFIRNLRLKQAAEILREKDLNISEVCYMVGFKHPNNFSVVFKEMYGMSPTAYAEAHKKQ